VVTSGWDASFGQVVTFANLKLPERSFSEVVTSGWDASFG
jgi:hypothetical protein